MIRSVTNLVLIVVAVLTISHSAFANCANWRQDATRAELEDLFIPGQPGDIQGCITNGADPNIRFGAYNDMPAIFFAIAHGFGWPVEELLDAGIELHFATSGGWTVAHYAAFYLGGDVMMSRFWGLPFAVLSRLPGGDATMSRIFTSVNDLEARTQGKDRTPLLVAAWAGKDSRAVRQLLQNGADIHAVDNEGNSSLHLAMRNSNPDVHVQEHVSQYDDNVYRESRPRYSSIYIRDLVAYGADPDQLNNNGETPLVYGLSGNAGSKAIEQILIAGADTSIAAPDGRLPWEIAKLGIQESDIFWKLIHDPLLVTRCDHWNTRQFSRFVDTARLLGCLSAGYEATATTSQTGETLLHQLAKNWPEDQLDSDEREKEVTGILEGLIAAGADINARDGFGRTSLHLAASRPSAFWVTTLLSAGADPGIESYSGTTPMDAARFMKSDQVALLLEENQR